MSRQKPESDCYPCIKWDECENAVAGHFCTQWQSKQPEPKGEDPNEAWERGEEVEF